MLFGTVEFIGETTCHDRGELQGNSSSDGLDFDTLLRVRVTHFIILIDADLSTFLNHQLIPTFHKGAYHVRGGSCHIAQTCQSRVAQVA